MKKRKTKEIEEEIRGSSVKDRKINDESHGGREGLPWLKGKNQCSEVRSERSKATRVFKFQMTRVWKRTGRTVEYLIAGKLSVKLRICNIVLGCFDY